MPVLSPMGIMVPSDLNDLDALGIADGEFIKRDGGTFVGEALSVPATIEDLTALFAAGYVKWNGSAFVRADAVENAYNQPLAGITESYIKQANVPSGVTEFAPTVPAGHKFVTASVAVGNPTTSAITVTLSLKRGGVTYPISVSGGSAPARSGVNNLSFILNLYPGDSFVFSASASGLAVSARGFLIPTANPLKPFTVILTNGDNPIYTCPVGKIAIPVIPDFQSQGGFVNHHYFNNSGATRIVTAHIVPSGGSADATNRVAQRSVANNAGNTLLIGNGYALAAGDSYVVNTDGTGDQAYGAWFFERDA